MEKKNLGSLRSVSIFGSLWLIRSEISDYLVRARQWERSHWSDLSVSMIKSDRSHWSDPRAAWKRRPCLGSLWLICSEISDYLVPYDRTSGSDPTGAGRELHG